MQTNTLKAQDQNQWLQSYYYIRAAGSVIWIVLAVLMGKHNPTIGAVLLVLYPAWDALANYFDASKSGGLAVNPPQRFNLIVSLIVTAVIIWALTVSMNATIKVFGLWAIFSGVLQLSASIRRWKHSSGQWAMILSGAQSALAGLFMIKQASGDMALDVTTVAPYAAFGVFYFLISAITLTVKNGRKNRVIC
ncbi:DUF308 domain-containing protein [Pantoea sp. Bo_2]|uniref:DUF308 domain-containing protein n=1 Tax=unclassified Pantoea TaxID=2630326 RepID=UPI001231C81A|nr:MULTISPECIES: DUF308 domain-containing protein [unclassified Pantoea]KAA5935766.1 DUF308 domain-containing protein [Pantoea sp. VH_3]KAA5945720.1 DUF308 domain-containing protein [Pantoea sp. VH_25]KAA5952449.1 DUF308 domain-containing protein [Pantoea sp. VH_16]KAA5957870.1 DUF308 domain-containing protein [Pantoea sp. VH_24]KAA5962864.1 DUF308 domain-containing protein [Pantoea sp. VH_18]